MSNKSPVFPISEPQHFSDYGFDPQIDYFQVLEEAMKHEQDTERTIDPIYFKLQKPICKDHDSMKSKRKSQWWKSALLLFKWRRSHRDHRREDVHGGRAGSPRSGPTWGPTKAKAPIQCSSTVDFQVLTRQHRHQNANPPLLPRATAISLST